MTSAQPPADRSDQPTRDAFLLSMLRRREEVLWAGEREPYDVPTVIAYDVAALRAQLPDGAGSNWRWIDSPWSWADVKATSAELTRIGGRVRSLQVGPREDDSFGITVELEAPNEAVDAYLAMLPEGLVRLQASTGRGGGTFGGLFDPASLDLSDPRPGGLGIQPPQW